VTKITSDEWFSSRKKVSQSDKNTRTSKGQTIQLRNQYITRSKQPRNKNVKIHKQILKYIKWQYAGTNLINDFTAVTLP